MANVKLENLSTLALAKSTLLYAEKTPYTALADAGKFTLGTLDTRYNVTGTALMLDRLQLGSGTVFLPFYSSEGDFYSEIGSMYAGGGVTTVAEQYGSALLARKFAPRATLLYTAINATFTVSTQVIEKSGQTFVSDGVVVGDFVSVTSSSPNLVGMIGEIIAVTETTITISLASLGLDTLSDATNFNFGVFSPPVFIALDNGDMHMTVGDNPDTAFHISNASGTNARTLFVSSKAGAAGHTAFDLEVDADTYSGVSGFIIDFDVTGFALPGDIGTIIDIAVQNTGAATGTVQGMDIALADTESNAIHATAVSTHAGVDVIDQILGDVASLDSGWSNDSSVFTDRTTAFNSAGTDVQIFTADNDYILVASSAKFDEINVALSVPANLTIQPTFEYSTAAGGWVSFTPADDTEGFTIPATIRFDKDALATWGQRTVNEVTGEVGAIDYYWVRITRTRNVLPTPPTEDTIKVTVTDAKFGWDKNGIPTFKRFSQATEPTTSQLTAGQMAFWTDTDNGNLYLCYNDGAVKTVQMT